MPSPDAGTRSAKRRSQPGQDLIGVQIQEPILIRTRRVKHQVPESHVDIRSNLLHVLVRVGGHDPTRGRTLGRKLAEAALDLAIGRSATLGVSYTGQLARNVTDHAAKGRFSWKFSAD